MTRAQADDATGCFSTGGSPFVWIHIGDLHLTDAEEPNHLALRDIVAQANTHLAGHIDFAVLPGDHDFKSRSLDAFYSVLGAQQLPKAITVAGSRCLFLDYVGAGTGGPDFKLGERQLRWLKEELECASTQGLEAAVFAHAYPADLADAYETKAFHKMLGD
jgi:Icc protein